MRFDSIAAIPSRRQVEFLPPLEDRTGDSILDLFLPAEQGFAFFAGSQDGEFEPAGSITTVNTDLRSAQRNDREAGLDTQLGINATDGVVVKVEVERRNPFDNFVQHWPSKTEDANLVSANNWIPNAVFTEINGDALQDLVFINLDSAANPQLNIALQDKQALTPLPHGKRASKPAEKSASTILTAMDAAIYCVFRAAVTTGRRGSSSTKKWERLSTCRRLIRLCASRATTCD